MPAFSNRVMALQPSATIATAMRARALKAEGKPVISLALGQPDFSTPEVAIAAAHQFASKGDMGYPPVDGHPLLKRAVQKKFLKENHLAYELDEITIGNGAKQLIFNAFMATVEKGDEVVIPAPYWVGYPLAAGLFGGVPRYALCQEQDGFRLTAEALQKELSPATKWVVLNFPNNPTGAVTSLEDMHNIADVLRRFPQSWIMCDEIYEHLIYEGVEHFSLAAIAPDLKERILTLNGVSKAYAMTGWRVGFAGAPAKLIKAMVKIQGNSTSGVCGVSQVAAAAALEEASEQVGVMRESYARRRALVLRALKEIKGVSCTEPKGAFYIYLGIKDCLGKKTRVGQQVIKTDKDFATALLEEEFVAMVHGAAFGYSPYLRLSYATDDASLTEACLRIKRFVENLQ
ncbi:pyridoxal phosphate-dependent aminotransferase [Entomobacter blattae]|uniref:Aminotransferase n=1 Tax=Entomobacter blattae TaxID=2762277 RepID=A0A7H1NTP8_9PROT|nr:pyridoxal phosphate-dependent aminotransferase [Entomobacter blattae]QNT79158.1 Aspartate aminotransferase [Entomobacter blattae]